MSRYNIRLATYGDWDEYLSLIKEAYVPLKELGIDWPSVRVDLDAAKKNLESNSTYVLEKDGEIASTVTIRFPWESAEFDSRYPFIWWFATKPKFKGQGIGRTLLDYVENDILKNTLKSPALTLGTSAKKHPWLLDMYIGRGYKVYEEIETDYDDLVVRMYKELIPHSFDKTLLQQ